MLRQGMGGALSLRRTSNPDLGGLASAETRVAKSTFYSNQATVASDSMQLPSIGAGIIAADCPWPDCCVVVSRTVGPCTWGMAAST